MFTLDQHDVSVTLIIKRLDFENLKMINEAEEVLDSISEVYEKDDIILLYWDCGRYDYKIESIITKFVFEIEDEEYLLIATDGHKMLKEGEISVDPFNTECLLDICFETDGADDITEFEKNI